uniref:Integrase n=1 Tax=Eiseniibacteriota bacterium TaxID=2212470 RepID=A0A832MKA1_UNCEI
MSRSSSFVASWAVRFRRFLARRGFSRFALKQYLIVARAFLRHLEARGVDPTAAQPSHIRSFLKRELVRYRHRQRREPRDLVDWRSHYTAPIHQLFRCAQGAWPPPSDLDRRLAGFVVHLRRKRFSRSAVINYRIVARRFLSFLEGGAVAVERVCPADVAAFVADERGCYRRRHGREPKRFVIWRCSLTGSVHELLRWVQGCWPPPPMHSWYERFRAHMTKTSPDRMTRGHYVFTVGKFLEFLEAQRISAEAVEPSHVEAYRRIKLAEYRRRHGRPPKDLGQFRRETTVPIHRLLRLVHGQWPPPSPPHPELDQLRVALVPMRYRPSSRERVESVARHFLDHLRAAGIPLERVRPADLDAYLRRDLRQCCRRYGHPPRRLEAWRCKHTRPLQALLRMAQGCWPPPPPAPTTPIARFGHELHEGFRRWMIETRGLSELTFIKDWGTAAYLLEWLDERASAKGLGRLTPTDLDAFIAWRTPHLRRATRAGVCQGLRSFLRYLHGAGFIERDLARCVTSPPQYWNASIPSSFTDAQVKAMLATTRQDRRPHGKRDYAILLLLATYGLRAGEITRVRLEDIDWRGERLRITQSKTGRSVELPLMSPVGEAILKYLRHGRPESEHRQVFLRHRAPYSPFDRGSCLSSIVHRRLRATGLPFSGRHGAHAFRYARAVSLLRASVPLKSISDLLGHSSAASTEVYLKLATDDLREVGLELPAEVTP